MELAQPLPSDGQLVDAARRGSTSAWDELESRHGSAVIAVAKAQRTRRPRRVAEEAMDRLRAALGDEPLPPDGAAAVRAVRPRAIAELTDGSYGAAESGAASADREALAAAFAKLPEPWQTVLWHGVVEQRSAGEMTPLLGRGVNDVIALQHTARSGLHRAYLRAIAEGGGAGVAEECRSIVPLLAAAGRGTLAAHDQRLVDAHVAAGRSGDPCLDCGARLDLVSTIDDRLPESIVPGITRLTVDRYRTVIGAGNRSFGSAALLASRTSRRRKLAVVGAVFAVVVAAVGALVLIRRPFEASPAASDGQSPAGVPAATVEGTEPPTATEASSPTTTGSTPTTSELLLRPTPAGPANTVELVFGSGTRALGVAPTDAGLIVELASAGRVFAGGTGTIDVTATNTSDAPLDANFEVRTPDGLVFDGLVAGEAECRGALDDAAFCNISLAAGERAELSLRLGLESSVVGRLIVDPGPVGVPLEVAISAVPRLLHSSVGRGEILLIGNTVISCADAAPECAGVRDLTGDVVNRWDVPMEFVGAFPSLGWRNSSSADLALAPGAEVLAAYLFWSGDLDERGQQVPPGSARERVSMLPPGAEAPIGIDADRLLLGDVDATQYLGVADVTEVVAAAGAGGYLVGNVESVEVQGSYAGWALVVVTADDAAPRRQHLVTTPFAWIAPEFEYRTGLPIPSGAGLAGILDVLAFEGEPGFAPERLTVGGVPLGGDNEFDGSITGPRDPAFVNNLGIDIEEYDLGIDAPDGNLTFDATSAKDGVRLAVFGLSVDLPT